MDTKRVCSTLCWFAAACLSVAAFVLVLAGITVNEGLHWTLEGFLLIFAAAAALAGMALLMVIAFRTEQHD